MTPAQHWLDRSPVEIFDSMASRHGETFGFVLDDVLARDPARPLIVDDFRTLPDQLAGLLDWPGQAVFLVPTPAFRRSALQHRYADPVRARANWGDLDPAAVLEARLARDALWDAEVTRQATELELAVDGTRSTGDLAADLAERFRLTDSC